jgi:hypothetical protein
MARPRGPRCVTVGRGRRDHRRRRSLPFPFPRRRGTTVRQAHKHTMRCHIPDIQRTRRAHRKRPGHPQRRVRTHRDTDGSTGAGRSQAPRARAGASKNDDRSSSTEHFARGDDQSRPPAPPLPPTRLLNQRLGIGRSRGTRSSRPVAQQQHDATITITIRTVKNTSVVVATRRAGTRDHANPTRWAGCSNAPTRHLPAVIRSCDDAGPQP